MFESIQISIQVYFMTFVIGIIIAALIKLLLVVITRFQPAPVPVPAPATPTPATVAAVTPVVKSTEALAETPAPAKITEEGK